MRLGMVGTGMIVKAQLEEMGHRTGFTVEALAGTPRSAETTRSLATRYGIPHVYDDFLALVEDPNIDTVYVGVPNSLHAAVTRQALLANKHVIVEKPLAATYAEALELSCLARERRLFLWEAINVVYLPNFLRVRQLLPQLGTIKLACCNYSQYSSRYDAFVRGETPTVFDPACAGGALMDLGVYNLHYLMGLFGAPHDVCYHANCERGIDTSGVITLTYQTEAGSMVAEGIAAKDCQAPSYCIIQGSRGYLEQRTPANLCGEITLHFNDGREEHVDENGFGDPRLRWEAEFAAFARDVATDSHERCYQMLDHSLAVMRVLDQARASASA
ncbi:MAG: Gfo/Idh/MocA family protein [Atopobiaceae bacterium]|jgi:predicted dehydrogenase